MTAKTPSAAKTRKKSLKGLDTISQRRDRGRPRHVDPDVVLGRSEHYREILGRPGACERLVKLARATHRDRQFVRALDTAPFADCDEFKGVARLIRQLVRAEDFPKRLSAQVWFLADSIAARGRLTPRSSRDLCERERRKRRRTTRIVGFEVLIACSCGYKGRSRNLSCPRCEATIPFFEEAKDALSLIWPGKSEG